MRQHNKTYFVPLSLLLAAAILLAGCGAGGEETASGAEVSEALAPVQAIDWSNYQMAEPQRTEDGSQWYLTEYCDDWLASDQSKYDTYNCSSTGTIDGILYSNFHCQSGSAEGNDLLISDYLDSYDTQTGENYHIELDLEEYGFQEGASPRSMDITGNQQAVFLLRGYGENDMPVPYASLLFYHIEEGVKRIWTFSPS